MTDIGLILIVDDDSHDVELLRHKFEELGIRNPIQVAKTEIQVRQSLEYGCVPKGAQFSCFLIGTCPGPMAPKHCHGYAASHILRVHWWLSSPARRTLSLGVGLMNLEPIGIS